MRRVAFWSIVTVLISAPFGAGTALAGGTLVLLNEEGEEVIRLDEEIQSSGLHTLELGRYLLKVDEPGAYSMLIGNSTILQIDQVEGDVDSIDEEDLSLVVFDADLYPGDQGQREAVAEEAGDRIEFQLTAHNLPEIYGWSMTLEYDTEQIAYVTDSFSPSTFIPNIMILERDIEGGLEIGGANFSKDLASGDGDLGNLGFEVLAGFSGRAELMITDFTVRKLDSIDGLEIESVAAITGEIEEEEEDLSLVVFDADLYPGDQGQREAVAEEAGDRIEFQLTAHNLPEIYGWSMTLEYDTEQIAYVTDSFSPSTFIPNIMILERDIEGGLEIGGANFSKDLASGDGDLGNLGFEVLAGFSGRAELMITDFTVRKLDSIDGLEIESVAAITGEIEEEEEDIPPLSGDEALSQLREENACPGCDLSGVDLTREDLHEADLSGADLSDANLFRTDLSNAVLEGAILREAKMLQTDLREANLRDSDLSGAKLISAKLQGADLTGANLDDASLNGARLTGAIWIDDTECGAGSVGRCRQ